MSLTSLILRDQELRDKVKNSFVFPKIDKNKPLLAEAKTKRYTLLGVAFDYIFRFNLERINHGKIIHRPLIAESAISRLDFDLYAIGSDIIEEVKLLKNEFLKTGEMSKNLIRQVIRMSYLDAIVRSGTGHEYIGTDADELDIIDLMNIFKLIDNESFIANDICYLNPTFGKITANIGGADADFIIDNSLIDIKTTSKIDLNLNIRSQLICYYALNKISENINGSIDNIGIYYSRFGYLYLVKITEIIKNENDLCNFVNWFQERINNKELIRKIL